METDKCDICPRGCRGKRFCGRRDDGAATVAKAMLHMWEEPCISGARGSGAVFFSGCNLRCSFCQNHEISRACTGEICGADELARIFAELEKSGAHNINLVTPTPHLNVIIPALKIYKKVGKLPVVYNTSAYENAECFERLNGLVDVYLPDLKYGCGELSGKYSGAADYCEAAAAAIDRMVALQPAVVMDAGLIKRGVIIRHLALPGHADDSERVLRQIKERWGGRALISLMRQFTPAGGSDINRKLTSYEYNRLLRLAEKLGLDGYFQGEGCALPGYTPSFGG